MKLKSVLAILKDALLGQEIEFYEVFHSNRGGYSILQLYPDKTLPSNKHTSVIIDVIDIGEFEGIYAVQFNYEGNIQQINLNN